MGVENIENSNSYEIGFGVENEVLRVQESLQNLSWFEENGYKISMPADLSEDARCEEIEASVKSEYDEALFNEYKEYIEENRDVLTDKIELIRNLPNAILPENIKIKFTQYGTGGSYNVQSGEIIVNVKIRVKEKVLGTVLHEVVHIAVQNLITKNNLTHWQKERFVDLIGNKIFPELRQMQEIREDNNFIDDIFDTYYPDIEFIAEKINNRNVGKS